MIYLDSDGVLADFDTAALNMFGEAIVAKDHLLWNNIRLNPKLFWDSIPLFDYAIDFVKMLKLYDNLEILTGSPKSHFEVAKESKINFYAKHFPGLKVHVCLAKDKHLFVKNSSDILIDDTLKNIHSWQKAGGIGIPFISVEDTIKQLDEIYD